MLEARFIMKLPRWFALRKRRWIPAGLVTVLAVFAVHFYMFGQDKAGFPDGYDAVQSAPKTHKVIFENALVRVLELRLTTGTTVPMHHHRWPSFFLSWDTGGRTPHVRYHRAGASVREEPSRETPVHPGRWEIRWMAPEPLHSVEILDAGTSDPQGPSDLRIEIKVHP